MDIIYVRNEEVLRSIGTTKKITANNQKVMIEIWIYRTGKDDYENLTLSG